MEIAVNKCAALPFRVMGFQIGRSRFQIPFCKQRILGKMKKSPVGYRRCFDIQTVQCRQFSAVPWQIIQGRQILIASQGR